MTFVNNWEKIRREGKQLFAFANSEKDAAVNDKTKPDVNTFLKVI